MALKEGEEDTLYVADEKVRVTVFALRVGDRVRVGVLGEVPDGLGVNVGVNESEKEGEGVAAGLGPDAVPVLRVLSLGVNEGLHVRVVAVFVGGDGVRPTVLVDLEGLHVGELDDVAVPEGVSVRMGERERLAVGVGRVEVHVGVRDSVHVGVPVSHCVGVGVGKLGEKEPEHDAEKLEGVWEMNDGVGEGGVGVGE